MEIRQETQGELSRRLRLSFEDGAEPMIFISLSRDEAVALHASLFVGVMPPARPMLSRLGEVLFRKRADHE